MYYLAKRVHSSCIKLCLYVEKGPEDCELY